MTRRFSLLSMLGFGAAAAQTPSLDRLPTGGGFSADVPAPEGHRRKVKTLPAPDWMDGQAKPDQCPVCATVADPVTTKDAERQAFVGFWVRDGLITRCERCNAAFWQDVRP